MRWFVLIPVAVLFLLVTPIASLQESTEPPNPSLTQQIIPDAFDTLLEEAKQAVDEARGYASEARDATGIAFNLLNLFQIIGIVVAIASFIGYRSALQQLESDKTKIIDEVRHTREKLEKEFQDKQRELESQLGQEFQEIKAQYMRQAEQATVAASLLPLGEQQYLVQDFAGAMETYKHALELDSSSPIYHYRLGYVYLLMENLEEAQFHLEESLKIDPKFYSAQAALGYVYRRKAEKIQDTSEQNLLFNQAEHRLLTALQASPNLVDLDRQSWWGALGALYRRRGQNPAAMECYEKATRVTPFSSYPYGNLATLHLLKGDYETTQKIYERVEKLAQNKVMVEPENYWWYTDLLVSRLALGKDHQIEEVLDGLFRTVPSASNYPLPSLNRALERLKEGYKKIGKNEQVARIEKVIKRIEQQMTFPNTGRLSLN